MSVNDAVQALAVAIVKEYNASEHKAAGIPLEMYVKASMPTVCEMQMVTALVATIEKLRS